jgi:hypothetical protein
MQQDIHLISFAVRHCPLFVLGFVLIGAGAAFDFHVKHTLQKAGFPVNFFVRDYRLASMRQYLKSRSGHGWSPWPAYLILPALITGLISLIAGLFLMGN